jgi:hypothetical protein
VEAPPVAIYLDEKIAYNRIQPTFLPEAALLPEATWDLNLQLSLYSRTCMNQQVATETWPARNKERCLYNPFYVYLSAVCNTCLSYLSYLSCLSCLICHITALAGLAESVSVTKGIGLYVGPVEGVEGTYHCSSKV